MSDINVGQFSEALNDKADRDLQNVTTDVDYVVESKFPTDNDPTWYRVYKSGWCEQGGVATGSQITVPLLKSYKDTSYYASWILLNNTNTTTLSFQYQSVKSKTTSSFIISASQNTNFTTMWEAKGYAGE